MWRFFTTKLIGGFFTFGDTFVSAPLGRELYDGTRWFPAMELLCSRMPWLEGDK